MKDIESSLRPNEVILEYVLSEPHSYCIWISRNGAGIHLVSEGRRRIEDVTRGFLESVRARRDDDVAAKQLYNILIGQLPPQANRELPRAIKNILQGQLWVSRDVFETFASHERTLLETHLSSGHSLTARERQVLHLLIRGLSNKDISRLIEISERTVKFHVSNILSKLQLEDRRRLLPASLQWEQKCLLFGPEKGRG